LVTIVTCTKRPNFIDNILQNYENQLHVGKELIIVLNSDDAKLKLMEKKAKQYKNVSVYQLPSQKTLGECLNFAISRSKYDFIAKFDDDDFYAPLYLWDTMKTIKETGADVVGKRAIFCYFEGKNLLVIRTPQHENKFTNTVAGATLVFKKDVWKNIKFTKKNYKEDTTFTKQVFEAGYKMYSGNKYNYTCIRKADKNHHTWNLTDEQFLKSCQFVMYTQNFKPYIIKSINNRGE
jgi:cellulose synthase/poly-beta-1,6-N-acetylglucosamine synthase-like glycosyltransferase